MKTLCAAVLLLAACHLGESAASTPTPAGGMPANLVLRTYEVPGDGAPQVRAVLKDVFWLGSDGKDSNKFIGRSEVGPDGRLVVMATEGVQEGVQALIESLGKKPPKAAATVETSYWVVFALPGKSGPTPAALQDVAPALQQIEKSDGPEEFILDEKLTLTQISGEMARVQGREVSLKQVASATASGISAEMTLDRPGQKFETRVNLTPGQILVLGSSGAAPKDHTDAPHNIYVLMRAALHDGPGR